MRTIFIIFLITNSLWTITSQDTTPNQKSGKKKFHVVIKKRGIDPFLQILVQAKILPRKAIKHPLSYEESSLVDYKHNVNKVKEEWQLEYKHKKHDSDHLLKVDPWLYGADELMIIKTFYGYQIRRSTCYNLKN